MTYLKRLLRYSKPYLRLTVVGLLCSLTAVLLGLAVPYLSKSIVDDVLVAQQFDLLWVLALMLGGASLFRGLFQYGKLYIFEYTSQKILYDLRSELYRKLQGQSFEFYDHVRTGLLMNRMVGDLQAIRQLANQGYFQVFEGLFSLLSTVVVMLILDVRLSLALFLIVPLFALSTRAMARRLKPAFREIRRAFEGLTSAVQENVTGIHVVKAFGQEDYERERFGEIAAEFTRRNIDAADIRSRYVPLAQGLNGLAAVVILLLGVHFKSIPA